MRSDLARTRVGPYRWADFIALDEDDLRELIDGELVEVEVPTGIHEYIVTRLAFYLTAHSMRRGGIVLASGFKVRITDTRGVMPDVQFFRPGNEPELDADGLAHGRPDLAVEIVSPSSRRYDRIIKLRYYASIKVPEYWLVDTANASLDRLTYSKKGYVLASSHVGEMTFAPPSFPGLRIPLGELWTPTSRPKTRSPAKPPRNAKPKTKTKPKTKPRR